ncbi:uncharacterized protein LOC133151754 isoform X3 [Syngnathus typhle]|uniref:uncharacterized protein LOC133151754 isoform X3 n=1 Tax=Syngnathus typhle TaxID=161592 RepID=UPI002A6A8A2E|nr:uncharacterized protein LOC133151754 isoform X3 [Syngnathus typhle]
MAEADRSPHEYRETHAHDRDGDGVKAAAPLRGRGCGRKRKGTPVKVFVTSAEEENNSEQTLSRGDRKEAAESKRPAVDGPVSKTEPSPNSCGPPESTHKKISNTSKASSSSASTPASSSARTPTPVRAPVPAASAQAPSVTPTSTAPTAPVASATAPATGSFPPSPNCRIREVHCGSQVRLVVIAIRDITKGEEITVDYSLTEWGENLGFRGSMSPAQHECNSDTENNNVKKVVVLLEDEPMSTSQRVKKQQQYQDYVTPSWSLSPSSSPISHSDASESDAGNEDSASPRGRTPRRRKKRRGTPLRKKTHPRTLSGHPAPASSSRPRPSSPSSSFSTSTKPLFKAPAPRSPNSTSNADVPRGGVSIDSMRQTSKQPPAPASPAATPPRGQNAVAVSVLKRSPPPVGETRKGGERRLKKERPDDNEDEEVVEVVQVKRPKEEDVEVGCAQSFRNELSKEIPKQKMEEEEGEEDEEEDNAVMDVDDESGAEDKEKDSLSSGRHQMLPLLSSLSSLVLYLRRLQHSAFLSLSRQMQSAEAWRLLCHSSLALLILYNRRRECEVSKLSITEYRARVTPQCPIPVPPGSPPALTPLEASLSPFERLVLSHLPRVGVQGKRGRTQPLILPPHSEPCLEILLQTRRDVGVDPVNPYVFARPYHSPATPLRGTDLLRSLARSSGTRNPRALTQTRVRRQVAILTQLLLLGEGEEPGQLGGGAVERLEHFLEREYHVTQNCAGIGQDPGLMGRVGRVVLCGERDGVLFRGMSLNHICLELDVMSGNSADSYSEAESEGEQVKEKPDSPTIASAPKSTPTLLYVRKGKNNGRVGRPKKLKNTQPDVPPLPPLLPISRRRGSGKRGVLKRPWSEAERAAVEEHLTQNINELRVPAKADCERCLQQCPLLVSNQRDWRAIKFYCHNRIQLLKKNQRRESEPLPLTVC